MNRIKFFCQADTFVTDALEPYFTALPCLNKERCGYCKFKFDERLHLNPVNQITNGFHLLEPATKLELMSLTKTQK